MEMDWLFVIAYKCKKTKFEVEIALNNIVGIMNTSLIWNYSMLDQRFHIIGIVFKKLVSENDLFKKESKLNSYSIMLMVIAFLQWKGVLPSL